jgi:hypothetical protein
MQSIEKDIRRCQAAPLSLKAGHFASRILAQEPIQSRDRWHVELGLWCLAIDIIEFVASGFFALGFYIHYAWHPQNGYRIWMLLIAEATTLLFLTVQFYRCGDFKL